MNLLEELLLLNNCKFKELYHVCELMCFAFKDNDDNQFNIHSQCMFRIINAKDEIIIGDNDYYFDDIEFDKKLETVNAELESLRVVTIDYNSIGDLEIELGNNNSVYYRIQVILNASSDHEMWRFIKVDSPDDHIVCYPYRISEE